MKHVCRFLLALAVVLTACGKPAPASAKEPAHMLHFLLS